MGIRVGLCLLAMVLGLVSAPAAAEWRVASSKHFVVYADDSERDIRKFAENLERFHAALGVLLPLHVEEPSPSNRVTIYIVDNEREVRRLYGQDSRYLGGFYLPRAGGSLAIAPRSTRGLGGMDGAMLVLLHEYAHHYFISGTNHPIPLWLSEGSAEFFASAKFEKDGAVGIGRPALHRAGELLQLSGVPLEQLFDEELYRQNKGRRYDSYYGRAWLLYHMLMFAPERQGQLTEYWGQVTGGVPSLEAAEAVFGDFRELETELQHYLKQRRMSYFALSPELLEPGQIEISELSEGAAAMMPVRIRSKRGVNRETAQDVLEDARAVAGQFPADPFVQAALAEAEYDAGNDDGAIAAADAALAADPANVNAHVQKGYALFRKAEDADDLVAAYKDAVKPFLALNKLESNHPLPLMYYYLGYQRRGDEPTELAVQGLRRALQLARFDISLRMMLVREDIRSGNHAEARQNLLPLASSPHGGGASLVAQALLDRLEASDEPIGEAEFATLVASVGDSDDAEGEDPDGEGDDEASFRTLPMLAIPG